MGQLPPCSAVPLLLFYFCRFRHCGHRRRGASGRRCCRRRCHCPLCREWLTVNLHKTWAMLLASEETESKALATVRAVHLKYAGGGLEATAKFTYLGVDFHCVDPIGGSAVAGRAALARLQASDFEGRCDALGLEAARLPSLCTCTGSWWMHRSPTLPGCGPRPSTSDCQAPCAPQRWRHGCS